MTLTAEEYSAPPVAGARALLQIFAALLLLEIATGLLLLPREPLVRIWESGRILMDPFGRQFLSLFAAGTLMFGWTAIRTEFRIHDRKRAPLTWLIAHVLAFIGFVVLAKTGLAVSLLNSTPGWMWMLCFLASAMFLVASAAFTILPARAWLRWFHNSSFAFAGGILAGLAGCFAFIAAGHWRLLSYWTMRVVEKLLPLTGLPVEVDVSTLIIGTPAFKVWMLGACSGLEGLGVVAVFLWVYLWTCRRDLRFPAAFALVPVALITVWLANAVRVTAMIVIGDKFAEATTQAFHSSAGWISLNLVALGVVGVSRRMPLFTRVAKEKADEESTSAGLYLLPLFAILLAAFVGRLGFDGIDHWYGLRVAAAAIVFIAFRKELAQFDWRPSWWAVAIGTLVFATWIGIDLLSGGIHGDAGFAKGLAELPATSAIVWLTIRVIGAVITVPLAEELAFRGYAMRKLIAPDFQRVPFDRFTWLSFLGSSVLFGALHGRWIAGIVAGMLFAYAAQKRGRFADAVYAHAVANALIAVLVLTTKSWSLWI